MALGSGNSTWSKKLPYGFRIRWRRTRSGSLKKRGRQNSTKLIVVFVMTRYEEPTDVRVSSSFLRNLVFRRGDQLKTQILRPLCEPFEKTLLVLFIIALLTNIHVFVSELHHAVNKHSEFVSCGDDAFRLS